MRKHDVRKWLHAVLDLLPVILIPVFMIYSHRHTLTERTEVEINYKYESNEVNTLDDLVVGNIYFYEELRITDVDSFLPSFSIDFYKCESLDENLNYLSDYQIDETYLYTYINNDNSYLRVTCQSSEIYFVFTNENAYVNLYNNDTDYDFTFHNVVFAVGNVEASEITNFKSYLTYYNYDLPQYTDYNVIESVSVNDTNKDIMTVFMDDFNGAIDKYFNMGNVFNLNGVYQWFNTNIFSGNAPTVIYSIWNIALYELVMDLLFLLYGLFMWFIDMIQKLMEKPLNSVK